MIDTKNNNEVASWNQIGDYIYLKFKGSFVEKHELSMITILHTFSNNNIHYNHKDITRPSMGLNIKYSALEEICIFMYSIQTNIQQVI